MNFVDKYHLVRRLLLAVFTYFFLYVTYKIFFNGITLDTFKVSVYIFLGGIESFQVKWYYNMREKENKK